MPTLVLMRHANTETNNPGGDKARRLTPRGIQEAQEAGVALRGLGIGYALVSTATRARETFTHLGLDVPVEFQEVLYNDGTETMTQRIAEMGDDVSTLPSLVAELAYASNSAEADQAQCWFPAAAYTVFTFDGPWSDLADGDFGHVVLGGVTRP